MKQELEFTRQTLGARASRRLLDHLVTQTLRGLRNWPTYQAWRDQLLVADVPIAIMLDEENLGQAKLKSVEPVKWLDLTSEDAQRGGFEYLQDLETALKRAGFRFKPLEEYSFYRIRFAWETNV